MNSVAPRILLTFQFPMIEIYPVSTHTHTHGRAGVKERWESHRRKGNAWCGKFVVETLAKVSKVTIENYNSPPPHPPGHKRGEKNTRSEKSNNFREDFLLGSKKKKVSSCVTGIAGGGGGAHPLCVVSVNPWVIRFLSLFYRNRF